MYQSRVLKPFLLALMTILLSACHNSIPIANSQTVIDALAKQLEVKYQVLANRGEGGCVLPSVIDENSDENVIESVIKSAAVNCFEVALSLTAPQALPAESLNKNWAIYFSQTDPLLAQAPGEFVIEHINGDLHRITPDVAFAGFSAGETKTLHFIVRGLNLTEAKIMPNYYVVAEGEGVNSEARVIASTRIVIDPETGLEVRPYAVDISTDQFKSSANDKTPLASSRFLYQRNLANGALNEPWQAARGLIPTPLKMDDSGVDIKLSHGIAIELHSVDRSALQVALERLKLLGVHESASGIVVAVTVAADYQRGTNTKGAYQLDISADKITIMAADNSGAFYGLQSLAGLVSIGSASIPEVTIVDQPRYDYRGMHIDVGRNFHSKQLLLDVMDQMAAYKLNKLHLHLGEDEGWRLQIPGLPELTDVGSRRCHDPEENTCLLMQLGADVSGAGPLDGFYSRADYIELVTAAEARHIQLIPSFDMPGHSRAVIKSMEVRYRKFMTAGDQMAAEQYLLSDLNDKTEYESIQYYSDNTINACMESPYVFLAKVIDEIKLMHEEAGQPLTVYHIGADETAGAWQDSPLCQTFFTSNKFGVNSAQDLGAYFIQRVSNLLLDKEITVAGWSDGLSHTAPEKMPKKVQSNIWDVLPWAGVTEANKQANRGWDVVLSTPDALYFDFPYEASPKEGGYYWATRHLNTQKVFNFMPGNLAAMAEIYKGTQENNFTIADKAPLNKGVEWAGLSGQIWSETIRSDEAVEYAVFPRLLALAERAWHQPDWELPYQYEGATYSATSGYFSESLRSARDADWQQFANTLGHKEFAKLDAAAIQYRVPTVGAVIELGQLKANVSFPGLAIEYRVLTGPWQLYVGPVAVNGAVEVRAISADGARRGRSMPVP